jgi:uncharacterized SAM-binding protein YcdF (DUF218 family)
VLRFVLVAAILAFLGLSARLFVFPETDSPTKADAVIVLAGARNPRLHKGLELMRKKVAPTLVISDAPVYGWPEANRLCAGHAAYKVMCFRPVPYSTRGEAEHIAELVRQHHWREVVVVTSTFHVTRARMLVKRCVEGAKVDLVGADYSLGDLPRYVSSEWGKFLYAELLNRDC